MAAIYDPNREVDVVKLGKAIQTRLPSYARPIFVRLVKKLDITGIYVADVFVILKIMLYFNITYYFKAKFHFFTFYRYIQTQKIQFATRRL